MRKHTITSIEWVDSYGAHGGWQAIDEDYKPELLKVFSIGILIYENDDVIALAPNYAEATDHTPRQANGTMVIPKACIIERIDQIFP